MFTLSLISIALAISSIRAAVVPRQDAPAGWADGYLEDYQTYHTRYLALGCQYQHNQPFFDLCCHPMLATENLQDNRAPECTPSSSSSSSAAAAIATDASESDDEEACEEYEDDESNVEYQATSTSAVEQSPSTISSSSPSATTSSSTAEITSEVNISSSSSSSTNDLSSLVTGGFGTYYYQNGVAGACGTVHSDNDLIVAMDVAQYGYTGQKSNLCGKKVQIFNNKNNKSVTCTIADACPTCNNGNSIDMSVAAFQQVADLSEGLISISWKLLD
ncbi:barwin-like endoglucanase [Dendrothele bispora CBS 962.96]|uniref:Barwin-like endoglucanase n=1 Tax=Dendrothele bispora (strain CBS 962.96) TaxID=1314807 RepID=A0A4S8L2V5_DENBC|nr:barwin-like endoglucanase [Dendrothele bispora CBS 962.96]